MKKLLLALMFAPALSFGTWAGKLDLQSSVQPMILRETHDGQWLAGLAHPNLWHLDHDDNPILHVGFFQAFNAENGNSSFGPLVGADMLGVSKELGADVPYMLGALGQALNIPSVFKPAVYFTEMLSLDGFAGYRPIHSADVNGPYVYGFGATLRVPFGIVELQKGN